MWTRDDSIDSTKPNVIFLASFILPSLSKREFSTLIQIEFAARENFDRWMNKECFSLFIYRLEEFNSKNKK